MVIRDDDVLIDTDDIALMIKAPSGSNQPGGGGIPNVHPLVIALKTGAQPQVVMYDSRDDRQAIFDKIADAMEASAVSKLSTDSGIGRL